MILDLLAERLFAKLPAGGRERGVGAVGGGLAAGQCSLVFRGMRASRSVHGSANCGLRNGLRRRQLNDNPGRRPGVPSRTLGREPVLLGPLLAPVGRDTSRFVRS